MKRTTWPKMAGAILLVACFALPMSSCSTLVDKTGKAVTQKPAPPGARVVKIQLYVFDGVRLANPGSWPTVLAFIWPLALLLHGRLRPTSWITRALWFVEPALLAGSIYAIGTFMFFGQPEAGTYVGRTGVAVYSLGWIGEAFGRWRSRKGAFRNPRAIGSVTARLDTPC